MFASDSGRTSGKVARVVSPGPSLEPRLVAEARGAADSVALRLRHHDRALHATAAPLDPRFARGVRCAGDGAGRGARVARNGRRPRQSRAACRSAHPARRHRPRAKRRGSAAGDRARTGRPPAADRRAAAGVGQGRPRLVAPWIEDKAGAELDALALTIDDQAAFAEMSRRLLQDLGLESESDTAAEEPDAQGGDDDDGEGDSADEGEDQDQAAGAEQGEMDMRSDRSEEGDGDSEATTRIRATKAIRPAPTRVASRPRRAPPGATGPTSRRPTITPTPTASTRSSGRSSCATRRSSAGCAPISTSRSGASRRWSRGSPTGSSGG